MKGFHILELVIVVAIISILGFVGYSIWYENEYIHTTVIEQLEPYEEEECSGGYDVGDVYIPESCNDVWRYPATVRRFNADTGETTHVVKNVSKAKWNNPQG